MTTLMSEWSEIKGLILDHEKLPVFWLGSLRLHTLPNLRYSGLKTSLLLVYIFERIGSKVEMHNNLINYLLFCSIAFTFLVITSHWFYWQEIPFNNFIISIINLYHTYIQTFLMLPKWFFTSLQWQLQI